MTSSVAAPAKVPLYDAVAARFGGRDLTFKIHREDLDAFETYAGESAFRMFLLLTAGQWTIAHITAVLRFACLSAKSLAHYRSVAGLAMTGVSLSRMSKPGFVEAALKANPPAQYATLATAILGAALFGIEAADATFTDGT